MKPKDGLYYIKVLIGLAFMLGFQFLPAPAPITSAGMALVGLFFGLIILYATVDTVWPNIVAMCVFAFHAFKIYPGSTAGTGIDEAGARVFGGSIPFFLIGLLLFNYALQESGLLRRIALWFVTRDIVKRSPWVFTAMLFLATLVLSLFMDNVPVVVVMLEIAHTIFHNLGFKKGDSWPRIVVSGIVWIACTGFWMTPIGHNLAILFTGMVAAASGQSVNMFSYMLVGIPVGLIFCVLMFCYFRFIVKPDVSQFKNVDFSVVQEMRPGKMDVREKIIAIVACITVALMVIPGLADFVAPGNAFSALFSSLSTTFILFAAVAVLAIVRINGKALLDVPEACSRISWPIIILVGGIVMVALSMSEATTGIPAWVSAQIGPIFNGMGPAVATMLIVAMCVILTNVLNNVAVGAIFCTICVPLTATIGIHPAILAMAISICAQMGYTTPAAFPTIAFATSDEYCNSAFVLRHGIGMTVLCLIAAVPFLYPLANLVF